MNPNHIRYFVRVGADVRGPVDEATIAHWLQAGMKEAEVCIEGGTEFVPLARTPLAKHMLVAKNRFLTVTRGGAISAVILLAVFRIAGRGIHGCESDTKEKKAAMTAALPPVGAKGTLRREGALSLCPDEKGFWGWPCRNGRVVAEGSRVQIMKAEVQRMEAVCRYWVQDGADTGASGDAPCAWFKAQ